MSGSGTWGRARRRARRVVAEDVAAAGWCGRGDGAPRRCDGGRRRASPASTAAAEREALEALSRREARVVDAIVARLIRAMGTARRRRGRPVYR